MKKIICTFALCLALGFGVGVACNHAPPNLTPAGQTAFTADQAVVRVNELMNAAIAANGSGALDTKTTRIIVTHFRPMGGNNPRSRVWKGSDGLWHASWYGEWMGSTSYWDRAMEWATTGRMAV